MVTSLEAEESVVQGMFVVGSGVDTGDAGKLKDLLSVPVIAPEEPQLALARGAALASAHALRQTHPPSAWPTHKIPSGPRSTLVRR